MQQQILIESLGHKYGRFDRVELALGKIGKAIGKLSSLYL
jgi:hypothetical protein